MRATRILMAIAWLTTLAISLGRMLLTTAQRANDSKYRPDSSVPTNALCQTKLPRRTS